MGHIIYNMVHIIWHHRQFYIFLRRVIIVEFLGPYLFKSGWLNATCILNLRGLNVNDSASFELKAIKNLEFSTISQIDGLELSVRIKPGQLRVNSGILTRDHSQFMLPMTNMSSIRGWVNSDPKLAAKAERLQRYSPVRGTSDTLRFSGSIICFSCRSRS